MNCSGRGLSKTIMSAWIWRLQKMKACTRLRMTFKHGVVAVHSLFKRSSSAGDDASTCVLGSSALSPGRVLADGSSAAILASLTPNMSDGRPPHPLQSDRKGPTRSMNSSNHLPKYARNWECSGRWTGTVHDGTGADRLRNPEMTMAIPRLQATNRAQTVGHAC